MMLLLFNTTRMLSGPPRNGGQCIPRHRLNGAAPDPSVNTSTEYSLISRVTPLSGISNAETRRLERMFRAIDGLHVHLGC